MLQTTYQHDYVPPSTNRYLFRKINANLEGSNTSTEPVTCKCVDQIAIEVPKAVEELECSKPEWTGVAPMGRLIEPRIIPTKFSPEQIENMASGDESDCLKMQPNRFLKILRTAYPDLYERLKQMPRNELNRRMDKQRLLTTYQIDFCNISEYPSGIYESLKTEEETSKINAKKLLHRQGPCSEFRANIMQELSMQESGADNYGADPCQKAYKPFKISFADNAHFVNSGDNSHWRASGSNLFSKRANISEYMDSISRNGCVIVKNNIHNHTKCVKGSCRHQLANACPVIK